MKIIIAPSLFPEGFHDSHYEGADKLHSNSMRFQCPIHGVLLPFAIKLSISGGKIAMGAGGDFEMRMPGKFQTRGVTRLMRICKLP